MFGEEAALSWSSFFSPGSAAPAPEPASSNNSNDNGSADDVVRTTATAATTRNVNELQAQIQRSGGVLTVGPNSSEYLVAVNNRLRFTVTRTASGQFEIQETSYMPWLIGGAAVLAAVLLTRK